MNELYYIEQTNFNVSEIIYNILYNDCIHFGFIKNDKANISGFLNMLIPNLALNREMLHSEFLKNNNNDENMAIIIEQNIYNIYLKTFDLTDDVKVNIQLRINKENKKEFLKIQDCYLKKYNMTFSMYIKTLLYEYAMRPLFQREILFILKVKNELLKALKQSLFVNFCLGDNLKIKMVPVDIAVNPKTDQNFIFGYSINKDIEVIKISFINDLSLTDEKLSLTNNEYKEIVDLEIEFFNDLNNRERVD